MFSTRHIFPRINGPIVAWAKPKFDDVSTGFPAKWRLRNERTNSILMTSHYPDLCSASDQLNWISYAARPIKSNAQIWVVTCHQCGISAPVSRTLFGGESSGSVAKCRLFSRARINGDFAIWILFGDRVRHRSRKSGRLRAHCYANEVSFPYKPLHFWGDDGEHTWT